MNDINQRDELGVTKLFDAVSDDDTALVKSLLTQGADPNIAEVNGTTPLMEAASGGHIEIMGILIQSGAKLDAKDHFGDTALDYAQAQKKKEAVEFLKAATRTAVKQNLR